MTQKKSWHAWTSQERQLFLELYGIHKRNFDKYIEYFPGRSRDQISAFYYNCKKVKVREDERKVQREQKE